MDYTKSLPFDGDTAHAFDLATASLTSLGFQVVSRDDISLMLTGPGLQSNRQSPLLGASRLEIKQQAQELALSAELGGVQGIVRFVRYFPIGLSLLLGLILFVVFSLIFDQRGWVLPVVLVVGINALVWLILAPILARTFRERTVRALDVLLGNLVVK